MPLDPLPAFPLPGQCRALRGTSSAPRCRRRVSRRELVDSARASALTLQLQHHIQNSRARCSLNESRVRGGASCRERVHVPVVLSASASRSCRGPLFKNPPIVKHVTQSPSHNQPVSYLQARNKARGARATRRGRLLAATAGAAAAQGLKSGRRLLLLLCVAAAAAACASLLLPVRRCVPRIAAFRVCSPACLLVVRTLARRSVVAGTAAAARHGAPGWQCRRRGVAARRCAGA